MIKNGRLVTELGGSSSLCLEPREQGFDILGNLRSLPKFNEKDPETFFSGFLFCLMSQVMTNSHQSYWKCFPLPCGFPSCLFISYVYRPITFKVEPLKTKMKLFLFHLFVTTNLISVIIMKVSIFLVLLSFKMKKTRSKPLTLNKNKRS